MVHPPRRNFTEPQQVGIKRLVVKAPAELPQLVMSYHTPTVKDLGLDWKHYALSILAGVVGFFCPRTGCWLRRADSLPSSTPARIDSA